MNASVASSPLGWVSIRIFVLSGVSGYRNGTSPSWLYGYQTFRLGLCTGAQPAVKTAAPAIGWLNQSVSVGGRLRAPDWTSRSIGPTHPGWPTGRVAGGWVPVSPLAQVKLTPSVQTW